MSKNSGILRALVGAILAFYGAKLLGMTLQDRPENYILFVAIAIAFIAIGTVYAVNSIKNHMKQMKDSEADGDDVKGEDESCE